MAGWLELVLNQYGLILSSFLAFQSPDAISIGKNTVKVGSQAAVLRA